MILTGKKCSFLAAVLLTLTCFPLGGQEPPSNTDGPDSAVFRATSRLVLVDVAVRDKRTGSRVDGLRMQDFQLLDNGRAQPIAHFSAPDTAPPLALFLIFDLRPDMIKEDVPTMRDALMPVLRKLRPEDHVGIMWSWYAGQGVIQPLTPDRDQLIAAFTKLSEKQEEIRANSHLNTGSNSGEYLAVSIRRGVDSMKQEQPGARRALLLVTDDTNAGARKAMVDAGQYFQANEATVSGLKKFSSNVARILQSLPFGRPTSIYQAARYYAGKTGGHLVEVKGDDYGSAFEEAIGDIVGRYQVGFIPDEARLDGKFHKLTVKVSPPDGARARDLEVGHRTEFFATVR